MDAATRILSTAAGTGQRGSLSSDGGAATQTRLAFPVGLAADAAGNLFVGDQEGRIRRVSAGTGIVSTYAGTGVPGFGGDGGPASAAAINLPEGFALDGAGNLFFSDYGNNRIRRIAVGSGVISTVAGNGSAGYSGDGGPATLAALNGPSGLALDPGGNLYVADLYNNRVRRVGAGTGVVTTVAGTGAADYAPFVNGAPATATGIPFPLGVAVDALGNLFVQRVQQIVRVNLATGALFLVAGTGRNGFAGDDGPATSAEMGIPRSLAVNPRDGGLYVLDADNSRVRAILPCRAAQAAALRSPASGETGVRLSPSLSWDAAPGAFRYDVYLDTANPPVVKLASDVAAAGASASNLSPNTTYFWKVVSKGDPFCSPPSSASSSVGTFTTGDRCGEPGPFDAVAPAGGATGVPVTAPLSWQPSARAASYDVYLGSALPPPLAAFGVVSTTYAPSLLRPGATYFWSVVARAGCDAARVTASPVRAFTVAGACAGAGSFSLASPGDGATGLPPTVSLQWSPAASATGYDLYFGPTSPPPLHASDLGRTTRTVSGLAPGRTYFWRVVARSACGAGGGVSTPIASFSVTAPCAAPGAPAWAFGPDAPVSVGQTYVLSWSAAPDLDAGGGYVVERSANASFSPVLDVQTTTATFASFVSRDPGTLHHRVRAVPACDPSKSGTYSEDRPATVVAGTGSVVFTVQPAPVVTALGEKLESHRSTFTLENLGRTAIPVILSRRELGSPPFFRIVDPAGGDAALVTLAPRTPKTFEVRFSGPPADTAGAYQGLVVVTPPAGGLANAPYAFVSLKVGGSPSAAPEFLVGGAPADFAAFPPFAGPDDSARSPLTVEIRNPGATTMELAAEVGPELWLEPETGWNDAPIAPRSTRAVKLHTRRSRALAGSVPPRFTYLTLRTRSGQTARLGVQDSETIPFSSGRPALPSGSQRSYLVPSLVKAASAIGNTFVSRLRLSNFGTAAAQVDLFFTPAGADGFDAARVRRATVVVPPNDIAAFEDPIEQLFGLEPPVAGTLEVRTAPETAGLLTVASSVDAAAREGGTFGFRVPTAIRGEGARAGVPHVVAGLTEGSAHRSNLILAETTGVDQAVVRVSLYDASGAAKGSTSVTVPRYGQQQISGVAATLNGGAPLDAGLVELAVESGGGAVLGFVTVIDNVTDDAAAYVSRPASGSPTSTAFARRDGTRGEDAATTRFVVPALVNGYPTFPAANLPYTFRSEVSFASVTASPATFGLTYRDVPTGLATSRTLTVPGRGTVRYDNALEALFGVAAGTRSHGPLFVDASPNGVVLCKVSSPLSSGSLGDAFPVVAIPSETLTGGPTRTPLYADGLEQSVDPARGTRSNLILNEVAGQPATLDVRLYEAANRGQPVAEASFELAPLQKLQLSTVFAALGLDGTERRKDRSNVLCVVTSTGGAGLVSAVITTIDNRTGDTKNVLLTPSGGVQATGSTIGF